MKRQVLGALVVLAVLSTAGVGVYAAPEVDSTRVAGPYEGTFHGVAFGDRGSSASLSLELTHRGDQVTGNVYLGEGLHVSAGLCGSVDLPAVATRIEGQTVYWNPRRLVADPTFDVGSFDLTIDFESNVSADGRTIAADATVDVPWFCGRDPVLTSTLHRD